MSVDVLFREFLYPDDTQDEQSSTFFVAALEMSLWAVGTALYAVSIHKFIILNSESYFAKNTGRVLLFAGIELVLALWAAMALLALDHGASALSLSLLKSTPYLEASVWFMVAVVLLATGVLLAIFATTLLPHVAVTPIKKLNLRYVVSLSRGIRLTIFFKLTQLSIAFMALAIFMTLSFREAHTLLPPEDTIVGYYLPLLFENISYSMSSMVFITLASLIYFRLSTERNDALASGN